MVRREHQSHTLTYQVGLAGAQARLKELVLYVCAECASAHRFGLIKLNKIIWRSDFRAFAERGVPVTGRSYQKLEFGPAPVEMPPVLGELQRDGLLRIERKEFGLDQTGKPIVEKRPIAGVAANLRWFSEDDISFVQEAIRYYWLMTGMETSDDSHGIAWRTREIHDPMPYESALFSNDELTHEAAERFSALGRDRGWRSH